jgi:Heterokaryon incompatibility protein (HET)
MVRRAGAKTESTFPIRVDTVCIYQREFKERSAQIKQMWKIFAYARTVRVWLDIDGPISFPTRLANFHSSEDLEEDPDLLKMFESIVWNPCWERVWIRQEIEDAQEFMLHCRSLVIPHNLIVRFFNKLSSVRHGSRATLAGEKNGVIEADPPNSSSLLPHI